MTNHPRHRHLVVAQVIAPCQEVAADIGDVAGHELAQRSPFKPSSIAAAHHAPPSDRLGRAAESRLLAPVVIPSVAPPGDRYLGAGVAENHLDKICCYMRIGEPARKHGVADEDIHHATRCAG
jgi:hypothetical protein